MFSICKSGNTILLTKTTAAQNEVALSYHRVRGLYFLAVVFATTVIYNSYTVKNRLADIKMVEIE